MLDKNSCSICKLVKGKMLPFAGINVIYNCFLSIIFKDIF
jgi:hypothetical protein